LDEYNQRREVKESSRSTIAAVILNILAALTNLTIHVCKVFFFKVSMHLYIIYELYYVFEGDIKE
jgi:hypothetical protein